MLAILYMSQCNPFLLPFRDCIITYIIPVMHYICNYALASTGISDLKIINREGGRSNQEASV